MTQASPSGLRSFVLCAACDAALVWRHRKLAWSAFGAMLVPTLYALIVLSSVWDPSARTPQLPVALVNQDTGLQYGTREANLGAEVLQTLRAQGLFDYRQFNDAEQAKRELRDGRLAFAVLLPPDFSRQAVLGAEPGAGRLILYLSEGNNYAAAGLAKRFAPELAHRVNETLNERRWTLALETATGSKSDLALLRQAVDRLVEGAGSAASAAHQAHEGSRLLAAGLATARHAGERLQGASAQVAEGAGQFRDGLRQLGDGLRSIDARAAAEQDVQLLRQGGRALQRGHAELEASLQQLHTGSAMLRDGAFAFELASSQLMFVDERINQGVNALHTGADQLERGLGEVHAAQGRLADGTQRFVEGSDRLADGLLRQTAAIGQLVARLPDEPRIGSFVFGAAETATGMSGLADGLYQLQDGLARVLAVLGRLDDGGAEVASGLRLVQASLPVEANSLPGTAAGLANSVRPVLEVVAPVPSEGAEFSPNLVPLALWMGAVMTAFLFNFRRLPAALIIGPRVATVAGRLVSPALVVVGQSLLMLAMLVGMLEVPMQRVLPLAVTLGLASLLFLCLIFALVHLFGDIGKMVAVLLLVVQMSAAGALLPIELTAPLFQALHRWLPLTWVVHAFRASLFGAYEGACADAWAAMFATSVAALAFAVMLGRWRPVSAEAYRPALEVD